MARSEPDSKTPLISVIIPVYNVAPYLPQCLDSVLAQTYPYLEIIVVDDGSIDGSPEIIRGYLGKDARIRGIFQKNQGVSQARNMGLQASTGKYVLFLDGDDWLEPVTCAQALRTAEDADADVVLWTYLREFETTSKPVYCLGSQSRLWDEGTIGQLRQRLIGLTGPELRAPQLLNSASTVWGKLYTRAVIGDHRFVDLKKIGTEEDSLFNIYVFSHVQRAAYVPALWYHYRKTNANSLTRNYKRDLADQWRTMYSMIRTRLEQTDAPAGCYQALSDRIALGLIGLGLNLAEDPTLAFREKRAELARLLALPQYRQALAQLPREYFPLHWRVFFDCARDQRAIPLYLLLKIMDRARGR